MQASLLLTPTVLRVQATPGRMITQVLDFPPTEQALDCRRFWQVISEQH
jgi:hypothetical protein